MAKEFYIFDLDGTLAIIDHRTHFVRGKNRQWKEFFEACDLDTPNVSVIRTLETLYEAGHRIEIWSGRSDEVEAKTKIWLNANITLFDGTPASTLLKRMRPATNFIDDVELKIGWLKEEAVSPTAVFDDRQKVVDGWRNNNIPCFQVAPGDFDNDRSFELPRKPTLSVMIGASGSGKSTLIRNHYAKTAVVSSDAVRWEQFAGISGIDQAAYTPAGFAATFATAHALVKAYIDGGIDVVYDATNLRRADRVSLLKNVGVLDDKGKLTDKEVNVRYVVVERDLDKKLASFAANPEWKTNEDIIRKHDQLYKSVRKDVVNRDGFYPEIDLELHDMN